MVGMGGGSLEFRPCHKEQHRPTDRIKGSSLFRLLHLSFGLFRASK